MKPRRQLVTTECPRCQAKLVRPYNTPVIECDSCHLIEFDYGEGGKYHTLDIDEHIQVCWYPNKSECTIGTRFAHLTKTALDIGWQPYNIPIDTIKMWLAFS